MTYWDVRKLRAKMVEHGDTVASLAAKLGLHRNTLPKSLNGKRELLVGELLKIAELYRLAPDEVERIFFPSWATKEGHRF